MKRPKLTPDIDIVAVHWLDAYSNNGWNLETDIDSMVENAANSVITVGIFHKYYPKGIVVYRSLVNLKDGPFYIPFCMVQKIIKKGKI